jgi:Fe-S-cluster containining protein
VPGLVERSDSEGAARGLRFQCQPGCTACCEQKGFVNVNQADIERAAQFLSITPREFEKKYVYRTRHRMRLRVPRGKNCHFLHEGGCSIHPAKPTQCRTFPFWPELIQVWSEWRKASRYCPGIGTGPLVQLETARREANDMKEAHPVLYGR